MNQADFIYGITDCVVSLGQNLIAEMLESMDESIREDGHRRLKWHIARRNETTLQTSLGVVKCKKTRFKNKETGESRYLLDKVIGLESVSKYKSVENVKKYILGDWDGIMQGVRNRNTVKGCHAEEQILSPKIP